MTQEIANGCQVHKNLDGGVTIVQRDNGTIHLSRKELVEFVIFASNHIRHTRAEHSQSVLLMGGPYHGEWREIPAAVQILTFPQLDKPCYVADLGVTPGTMDYTNHVYSKANDIAIGGIRFPFEIFEHSSLREANIARAARLLEEELNVNGTRQTITKQDLDFRRQDMAKVQVEVEEANRKRNCAVNQLTQSEKRCKQTYEDGLRLTAKRRALQFHHGV